MAKRKSAVAIQRRKDILNFLEPLRPISMQSISWWKLCTIDAASLYNPLLEFYSDLRGSTYLVHSSQISQHDLAASFQSTPNLPTIQRVYQNLENNRLAHLGVDILRILFDSIDPGEGGGSGVLSQYALTKAVFPLLERQWDLNGNKNIAKAFDPLLRSDSLIKYPRFQTTGKFSDADHIEHHQCWSLKGSSIVNNVHSYHREPSAYQLDETNTHLPRDWKRSLRDQLQQLYFSHLKTFHGGHSPELALSCLMGTPNSPPCDLASHYKQYLLVTKDRHIAINLEYESLEDIIEDYHHQTSKRILLSVEEVAKIQRLIVLKNFTSAHGFEAWPRGDIKGRYHTQWPLYDFMEDGNAAWILQRLSRDPVRSPANVRN